MKSSEREINRGFVVAGLLALICVLILGCGGGGTGGGTTTNNNLPTQGWTLTNDAGQVAYVTVAPFTYSGTFTETSSSPGWWVMDSSGNPTVRIPLNGTISHSGQYDTWDFNVTVQGGGMQVTGQGTGTANGNYPAATQVQGTLDGTVTSPMGSEQTSDTWTGNNYTVWTTTATLTITAPSSVAAGAKGLIASVPAAAGDTFAWTITDGTITAGGTTNQITFTAGASGTLVLGCTESNASGTVGSGTISIPIAAGVTIASPIVLLSGSSVQATAMGPGAASSTVMNELESGNIGGLSFSPVLVGAYGSATPLPSGAPAGTEVINIPPGDGESGFFEITFTMPSSFTSVQLSGAANIDDEGQVFLNGTPITPSLGSPGMINEYNNTTFSTSDPTLFYPGVPNVLVISDANLGGPSGAAFYITITFQ